MDTYTQPAATKRQFRSLETKLQIVQEALAEGASVARVARGHGVNANLVFNCAGCIERGDWAGATRPNCCRSESLPRVLRPDQCVA